MTTQASGSGPPYFRGPDTLCLESLPWLPKTTPGGAASRAARGAPGAAGSLLRPVAAPVPASRSWAPVASALSSTGGRANVLTHLWDLETAQSGTGQPGWPVPEVAACGKAGPGLPRSLPQGSEASPLAPCFVYISAKVYFKTTCYNVMCHWSEKQKSLDWEDKCLFLVLHNQVLTFKLVTYSVDLSRSSVAFISKVSEACKTDQTIQKFLIPCNKSICSE